MRKRLINVLWSLNLLHVQPPLWINKSSISKVRIEPPTIDNLQCNTLTKYHHLGFYSPCQSIGIRNFFILVIKKYIRLILSLSLSSSSISIPFQTLKLKSPWRLCKRIHGIYKVVRALKGIKNVHRITTRKLVPCGHPTFSRSKRPTWSPIIPFFFFSLFPSSSSSPKWALFHTRNSFEPSFSSCSETTELLLPRKNRLFSRNKSGGVLVAPRSLFVKPYETP